MFTPQLFLAQKLQQDLFAQMDLISPTALKLFTSGGEHYLTKKKIDGEVYLGKYLPPYCSLRALKRVEKNLVTLLLRVFPKTSPSSFNIHLILLEDSTNTLKT